MCTLNPLPTCAPARHRFGRFQGSRKEALALVLPATASAWSRGQELPFLGGDSLVALFVTVVVPAIIFL